MSDPNRFCRVKVRDVQREVEAYRDRHVTRALNSALAVFLAILFAVTVCCCLMGL